MWRKAIVPACPVCVLVLFAGMARSEPSFRGYSGLLKIPTTDTLERGQYNFGLNTTEAEDLDDPSYLANFGIADDFEAGIWWFHPEHGDNDTVINLKYRFEPGGDGRPSFAVGITDVMDEVDTGIYAVGTWEFGDLVARVEDQEVKRIRLHAGLGGGAIDDFFFGAEARFGPHFIVMAEHMNDEFSIGARARLWRNFTAQAGLLDMDDLALAITYTHPMSEAGTLAPVIIDEKPGADTAKAPEAMMPRVKVGQEEASRQPAEEAVAVVDTAPAPEADVAAMAPAPEPEKTEAEEAEPPPVAETVPEAPSTEAVAATPPPAEEASVAAPEETGNSEPAAEEALVAPAEAVSSPAEEAPAPPDLEVDHSKPTVPIPLDGLPVEVEGGHAFVPARQVASWLGFRVDAEHDRRGIKVTVHAGLKAASFYIGDDRVEANGEQIKLSAPTYYLNQRIAMVPVELFEILGVPMEVDTDASRALLERHDAVGVVQYGK
jgi:hypothetical protein